MTKETCLIIGGAAGVIAAVLHLGVLVYGVTAVVRLHQNPFVLPAVIATLISGVIIATTLAIFSSYEADE
jgi:hypothetical protein